MAINDTSKRQNKLQDVAVQGYQMTINKLVTRMLYQFQDLSSYSTKSSIKCLCKENFCTVVILSISQYLLVLFPFTFHL